MRTVVILATRALLVAVALIVLAAAAVLVPLSHDIAVDAPEAAHLRLPVLAAYEASAACAIGLVVCVWLLLDAVARGTIFTGRPLKVVDAALWCFGIALVTSTGGAALCVTSPTGAPPVVALGVLVEPVALLTGLLLLLTLRGLLAQATEMHSELEAVV